MGVMHASTSAVLSLSKGSARMSLRPEPVEGCTGGLPVMDRSVHQLIDRQIGRPVRVSGREFLIELDA
jgi:hypothetical protein